eukprot:13081-Pyramimonas_sp.AAC.1
MQERLLKRGETSGRADDNIETIKKRFDTFTSLSVPVATYYEERGKCIKISAVPPANEVYSVVMGAIGPRPGPGPVTEAFEGKTQRPKSFSILHFNDVYNIEHRDVEPVGGAARFVAKVLSYKVSLYSDGHKRTSRSSTEGLLGLVEQEWLETLSTINPRDCTYIGFVEEGRRLARELKAQGAEVVLVRSQPPDELHALTHMRMPNDVRLAEEVFEIDAVLGGHDHDYALQRVGPSGTLVLKSGSDFRELSLISVTFGADGVRPTFYAERIEIVKSITPDPEIDALVHSYEEQMGSEMEKVLGKTCVELDGRFAKIRTAETNLGNLVCDCLKIATEADCVIMNAGTLRSDMVHGPGLLKKKDLFTILPMMDTTSVLLIKGRDIIGALENGVSMFPKLEGRFPQVSGIRFQFDSSKAIGSRVLQDSVYIAGEKVDLDREYRLATKEYLTAGKDGYTSFLNAKTIAAGEEAPLLPPVLMQFFKCLGERVQTSKRKHDSDEPNVSSMGKFAVLEDYALTYDEDGTSTISIKTDSRIVNVHEEDKT